MNPTGSPLRFSVVVCCWNSEPFIAQALNSVLMQRWPEIELIFVDGGSTDGTLERIRAVERPKTILENVRGGVAAAMNAGLRVATGDVVAHLHADDYYLGPDVIAEAAAALEESGAQWVFGRAMDDMNDGRLLPEGWAVPRYSYGQLLWANFIPHQATFVRRPLFEQVGTFDGQYRFAMDYDMWLRIGKVAEPKQVDRHWVAFRRHAGSLTEAHYTKSMREDFLVRMKHAGYSPQSLVKHGAHYAVRRLRHFREHVGV
jgi:glycosyltransferase involved in cell wall biosynthesis